MHRAAEIKPVVIDESLIDLESLELAREQGYSGVALKACKGHSGALLMGAAAQKHRLFLCVQDLTCIPPAALAKTTVPFFGISIRSSQSEKYPTMRCRRAITIQGPKCLLVGV